MQQIGNRPILNVRPSRLYGLFLNFSANDGCKAAANCLVNDVYLHY